MRPDDAVKLRNAARAVAVAVMGVAVMVATGDGFAQSYAGLYGWAIGHGLGGWKADSFPLLVDTFVGVGEVALFLLAIDGHRLGRSATAWLDLLIPAGVAASGWTASLVFNVGHVAHKFAFQATAAVPPLASMVGLLVLLRTLHRYVTQEADTPPATEDTPPATEDTPPATEDTPPATEDTPPATEDTPPAKRGRVAALLAADPDISAAEIARRLGLSDRHARRLRNDVRPAMLNGNDRYHG